MGEGGDPVLLHWLKGDRAARQAADVLLCEQSDPLSAVAWILRVLADFPGCLGAAARHDDGHWCLIGVRATLCQPDPEWTVRWADLGSAATESVIRRFCLTALMEEM